jgi:hypothetical protein
MATIRETLKLSVRQNLKEHRTYRIWAGMRYRCRINHEAADRYYLKGIRVCERWDSFLNFLEDMGHPPSENHSLDRIDPHGNYEPSNCRWATKQEQSSNKRNVQLYEINGEKLTTKGVAKRFGINYHTLRWRMQNKGMSLQQALHKGV